VGHQGGVVDHGAVPDVGRIVNDAWGTRSGAILSHAATGTTASFSNHAMVTGHGRGFSGAICSPDPADDVVKKLKALRRSKSVGVASGVTQAEPTHSRRLPARACMSFPVMSSITGARALPWRLPKSTVIEGASPCASL